MNIYQHLRNIHQHLRNIYQHLRNIYQHLNEYLPTSEEYLPTSEEYLPTYEEMFTDISSNIYQHLSGEWFPKKDCSVSETSATTYLSTSLQTRTFTDTALRTTAVGSIKRLLIQTILLKNHTNQPISVKLHFVPFPEHNPTEHSTLKPIRNRGRHSILSPK
jgi:hypothetical protein